MKTAFLTALRLATPAAALAAGLVIGTIAGSVSAQPISAVDARDDLRAAMGATATPHALAVARAPVAGRGYVRQPDEVAAFGLTDDRPTVVAGPRVGRGYLRRPGEATAFGLADARPLQFAVHGRPGYTPWASEVR